MKIVKIISSSQDIVYFGVEKSGSMKKRYFVFLSGTVSSPLSPHYPFCSSVSSVAFDHSLIIIS